MRYYTVILFGKLLTFGITEWGRIELLQQSDPTNEELAKYNAIVDVFGKVTQGE